MKSRRRCKCRHCGELFQPERRNRLLVTLGVGLSTIPVSIAHALHGNVQTMSALAEWAQSVLTLQPKPLLVQATAYPFQRRKQKNEKNASVKRPSALPL